MRTLRQTTNVAFANVPGIKLRQNWPEHIRKKFFNDVETAYKWRHTRPEDDWMFVELDGTTFSGHFNTTLFNTLRSLCYAWYYLSHIIPHPWDSDMAFVICAGDDVVIYVDPSIQVATE